MGARVESLPVPVDQPGRKFNWLPVAVLAVCMAAAAGIFALQRGASDEAAPPISVAKSAPAQAITGTGSGLLQVANASGNTTGHSLAYFTGAGGVINSMANNSGHSLAYFTGAGGVINSMANDSGHGMAWFTGRVAPDDLSAYQNSGFVTGSGPGLAEFAGQDLRAYANSGPAIGTGPGLSQLGPNDSPCSQPRC